MAPHYIILRENTTCSVSSFFLLHRYLIQSTAITIVFFHVNLYLH